MNLELLEVLRNQISYYRESSRSFFDSSSFTLISDRVLESVSNFYKSGGTRPTTGLYPGTALASTTIESCRKAVKEFFAVTEGEIVFPTSRGIGLVQILYSLSIKTNISILASTSLDHDSWLPAFEFAKQKNIPFVPLSVTVSEQELERELTSKISGDQKTVPVLLVPFRSLGTGLTLSNEFFKSVKNKFNAFTIIDCTFAVGVMNIAFSNLSIDAAIFDSNIGLGGPIGSGIMYLNEVLSRQMHPYMVLGNGTIKKVDSSSYSLEDIPTALETAINPAVMAGITSAIKLLEEISITSIETHNKYLLSKFLDLSSSIEGLQLTSSSKGDSFSSIIGFLIPTINMHEVAMYLDEVHQIDVRTGSFCAHQLIDQLYKILEQNKSNLGILQLSFHYYNTEQEIEKLITGIREFLKILKN